jgi:hypothetical protein
VAFAQGRTACLTSASSIQATAVEAVKSLSGFNESGRIVLEGSLQRRYWLNVDFVDPLSGTNHYLANLDSSLGQWRLRFDDEIIGGWLNGKESVRNIGRKQLVVIVQKYGSVNQPFETEFLQDKLQN